MILLVLNAMGMNSYDSRCFVIITVRKPPFGVHIANNLVAVPFALLVVSQRQRSTGLRSHIAPQPYGLYVIQYLHQVLIISRRELRELVPIQTSLPANQVWASDSGSLTLD